MDAKVLDDLAKRLTDSLPNSVRVLHSDVEKNLRAVLQSTLTKLNLVTREEFEVQKAVLERAIEQMQQLQQQMAQLEAQRSQKVDSDV